MSTEPLTPRRQWLAGLAIGALAAAGAIGAMRAGRGVCDPLAGPAGVRLASKADRGPSTDQEPVDRAIGPRGRGRNTPRPVIPAGSARTMTTLLLLCSCGRRIKAPGATPGRVGRCPSCGALLRVPEPEADGPGPDRR